MALLEMRSHAALGVNVDHVATVRNARGGLHPDPVHAACVAIEAGADGITAHLREDRRHIRDEDIARLKAEITKPLNLEMAATDEMLRFAVATRPHAACLVPERREERTTEGGLDAAGQRARLRRRDCGAQPRRNSRFALHCRTAASDRGSCGNWRSGHRDTHRGMVRRLGRSANRDAEKEWQRIVEGAKLARQKGLEVHAGHGLDFQTAEAIAALPEVVELNIGHFLIGEAIYSGACEVP